MEPRPAFPFLFAAHCACEAFFSFLFFFFEIKNPRSAPEHWLEDNTHSKAAGKVHAGDSIRNVSLGQNFKKKKKRNSYFEGVRKSEPHCVIC